jgi:hypothetical protein
MSFQKSFVGARLCAPLLIVALAATPQLSPKPWPGADDARTVDPREAFTENLSGLAYESNGGGAALWGVQNRPGMLFRLKQSGTQWMRDAADGWKDGRTLRYKDGTGSPDAEGITFAGATSSAGIYVATERNNDANSRSRNSVLRFDPAKTGAALTATHEWDLTTDLPKTGANEGIEAIAWVPDSYLVEHKFHDEATGRTYSPGDYPNHGNGLFFVGIEADGSIHAFALNHEGGTHKRIATVKSGLSNIMVLEFDQELKHLWAVCDDNCGTRAAILQISSGAAEAGRFAAARVFDRPRSLPNVNNEGFAVATQAECKNGHKPVYWSDDSDTGGHSIRTASVTCAPF